MILTDEKQQKKNRVALVAEIIGDDAVKAILTDTIWINRVFPLAPRSEKKKRVHAAKSSLLQMADSEKARLLASRYEGIAIHPESEAVFVYRSGIWEEVTVMEFSRKMVAIYNENRADFARRTINNVIEALKLVMPVMSDQRRSLIPFANGVYDMETGEFTPHQPGNWITHHNGIEYTAPVPVENLHDQASNFHKWLRQAADNQKYEKRYTTVVRAVVIATNNTPMIFTDRAGGVARRRVIFQFNNPVREDERDPDLSEKIAGEIPVVICRLLENFTDPEKARKLLKDQRDSDEALEIKRATNPVIAFCEFLEFLVQEYGLMIGGGGGKKNPRQFLYPPSQSLVAQGLETIR
ncbi:phage-associated DNA primase [Trabulsiella guamensis ATCC 49490]|uniref:Phage-associated DNA primase n=1 Tax=Trabulsiella guamensis ATCC 49490 TaxID=1005994 RepID=A0A085A7E6_9ENTR|nr:phage-associated DNA primase [Trabulsiella guamensis ATCC 49490]